MKEYILYLNFNIESIDKIIENIDQDIIARKKSLVITPNLDFLRLAYKNKDFRKIINTAEYSLIDGKPIVWLAKKQKLKVKKISGSDFVYPLLDLANRRKYSVLIFGGKDGVATKAANNIRKQYGNIKSIYTYTPPFGYEKDKVETDKCINFINSCNADIVLLCTGAPKTEKFYAQNKEELSNAIYLSIGATVDFLAGNIKRAPKWMSNIGLEWLYRLSKDFKRLFKRYLLDFGFYLKINWLLKFNKKKIKEKINEIEL